MSATERITRINRGIELLDDIGITYMDLTERAIVVVGNAPGELQPPYRSAGFEMFASTVLQYIANNPQALIIGSGIFDHGGEADYNHSLGKNKFPETKVFEVVGMNSGACVAYAVQQVIDGGDIAYVSSNLISDLNAASGDREPVPYSKFTNGRVLINEVLRRKSQYHCVVIAPETFIFYSL